MNPLVVLYTLFSVEISGLKALGWSLKEELTRQVRGSTS